MRGVKLPKFDNRLMRFLTTKEAQDLLETLKGVSAELYISALLALFCGLRAGEIHSLTWADIDFTHDTIFLRDPKGGKNRHAYMTPTLRVYFRKDMLLKRLLNLYALSEWWKTGSGI